MSATKPRERGLEARTQTPTRLRRMNDENVRGAALLRPYAHTFPVGRGVGKRGFPTLCRAFVAHRPFHTELRRHA